MRNPVADMMNSTNLTTEGFGGFMRPTAAERAAGRFMRAPDHDAGTADAGAATANAGDASGAGASGDAGSATDTGTGEGASTDTGATDDGTALGSAASGEGAGDGKGADEKDPAATASGDSATVPETYELKLASTNEAGEEVAVDLDPVLVEAATPLLKEAGLSNEAANKLLPLVPKVQEQLIKQQNDGFAKIRSDWLAEAKADPEMGGAKFDETVALAAKALDHFGARSEKNDKGEETNGFRKLLNESGLGNHPDMIRMFRSIGAAISEDGDFVRNTTEARDTRSREEKNYPDDTPKK